MDLVFLNPKTLSKTKVLFKTWKTWTWKKIENPKAQIWKDLKVEMLQNPMAKIVENIHFKAFFCSKPSKQQEPKLYPMIFQKSDKPIAELDHSRPTRGQ